MMQNESQSHNQNVTTNKSKKKHKKLSKDENNPTANVKKKSKGKVIEKVKKKDGDSDYLENINTDIFIYEEIAKNKEASDLIFDLVNCYTRNSSLSEEELNNVNTNLFEKTVHVFLYILNKCVEKIFHKLINTDYFRELILQGKVVKKDAICQTDAPENS